MAQDDKLNDGYAKQEHQHEQQAAKTVQARLQDMIPIIDFATIDGPERQRVCQQIAEACENWGFFHLINHGVDQSLIKRVKDVSLDFFHSPVKEKLMIKVQAPRNDGWNHCEHRVEGNKLITKDSVEHLLLEFYPERQENLEVFPKQPEAYRSTLFEYTEDLDALCDQLLGVLSEMLGLSPEAIKTGLTAGTSSKRLGIRMRTNSYGLGEGGEALPNLCHAHSDPGALTFLLADDVPGLEIRKNGEWVKVDPIPGGLIINVSEMLEVVSNGRYKSVEHRGLPASKQERLTLETFRGPLREAVIGPIPSLLDESHPPLYQTIQFGAYIVAFIKAGLEGKGGLERFKL